MRIGLIDVEPALALAPMAGVTSYPFRLLAKKHGCGLVYSEMISARALLHGALRSVALLYHNPAEKPVAWQLFGSEAAILAGAACILESRGADIIDLNLGCPTRKIVRNGDGGALMRNPELCSAIFHAVAREVRCPVTVKMRSGWDRGTVNAVEIACRAEEAGLKAVAVHGRTVEQGYSGKADWDIIGKVKQAVAIPVWGNGDVDTPRAAGAMLEYSGCDGVMIGRAAMGNPWIFARVRSWLEEGTEPPAPSPGEKVDTALHHLEMLCRLKGEKTAVLEMRRHAAWYIKGLPGAAEARRLLVRTRSAAEMSSILSAIAEGIH